NSADAFALCEHFRLRRSRKHSVRCTRANVDTLLRIPRLINPSPIMKFPVFSTRGVDNERAMPSELKDTLNLPKTDYAMKANLPQNEPKRLEFWKKIGIYQRIREARKDAPQYLLH